jgi:hypothetical protein
MKTLIKLMVVAVAAMLVADQYNRNKPAIKAKFEGLKKAIKKVVTTPDMHNGEVVTNAEVIETVKI